MYSDASAAALYDVLNPAGPDDNLYLERVLGVHAVLDVGCGIGRLLHRARDAGHVGRLCGVDPDPTMLALAERRGDVEWLAGTAASMRFAVDPSGRPVRISYDVESVVDDVVTVTETTSDPDGTPLRIDRASLRFLDVEELDRFLSDAGFLVETRYGGWHGEPFEAGSPEIITVARRVGG